MPPRVSKPFPMVLQRPYRCQVRPGRLDGASYPCRVRCFVEPSPAGGYFVRLRGEPVPVSHHDTEEEAEAAAAAYERGLADAPEHLTLDDGADVVIRAEGDAFVAIAGAPVARASYAPDREQPHLARVTLTIEDAWRDRGLEAKLLRRLAARAREHRIRGLIGENAAVTALLETLAP
jgi:hypothetical protein